MATIRDLGDPVGPAQVADAELELGARLPAAYRAFVLAHNGGHPEPAAFFRQDPMGGGSVAGAVNELYELDELRRMLGIYLGRIPDGLLPIGDDQDGNQLLLGLEGRNAGRVYLWTHADEHRPPTFGNVWFVADSFDRFLGALFAMP